jgi:hypothetical protein
LTTKFTQHTQESLSSQLSASCQKPSRTRRSNLMGLCLLIARQTPIKVSAPQQANTSGTHKNLQRLVICPIYSVVKYRPRWLSPANPASAGMGLTHPRVCKLQSASNPMFGARQLS